LLDDSEKEKIQPSWAVINRFAVEIVAYCDAITVVFIIKGYLEDCFPAIHGIRKKLLKWSECQDENIDREREFMIELDGLA